MGIKRLLGEKETIPAIPEDLEEVQFEIGPSTADNRFKFSQLRHEHEPFFTLIIASQLASQFDIEPENTGWLEVTELA